MRLIDGGKIINKFFAGETSDSELDLLKNWLTESRVNRKEFDEENEIWQETNLQVKYKYFNAEKGWENVRAKIARGNIYTGSRVVVLKKSIFWSIAVAASIAILIALGNIFLWRTEIKNNLSGNNAITKIRTHEGERVDITLPDSTRIIMNSGSTIEYSNDFNVKDRKIRLFGEAYFDVVKNSEKPFQVYLDKMTVVATGTKFNIFSYNSENRIEATLEDGSINVVIPGKETIYVSPGQQVTYFTNNNKAVVEDVTIESFTSWKENILRLNDTPFEEALRNIARRHNVIFEIQDSKLLDLKYTATFIDESIEEIMQMLKAVSPIGYKIVNRTTASDKTYLKPKIIITSNNKHINNK